MSAPRRSFVETPFAGDVEANLEYTRKCMQAEMEKGHAPFTARLLYMLYPEGDTEGRARANKLAGRFREHAVTVFYVDNGWSEGMKKSLRECDAKGLPWEVAALEPDEADLSMPA